MEIYKEVKSILYSCHSNQDNEMEIKNEAIDTVEVKIEPEDVTYKETEEMENYMYNFSKVEYVGVKEENDHHLQETEDITMGIRNEPIKVEIKEENKDVMYEETEESEKCIFQCSKKENVKVKEEQDHLLKPEILVGGMEDQFLHAEDGIEFVQENCEETKHEEKCEYLHKRIVDGKYKLLYPGVLPYSCEVCGKSYTRKDQLNSHKRLHTGERFSCRTEETTKQFINLRIKYNDLFTGKRGSAAVGYSMIAREMGLPISAKKSLEKKWANLTAKYRMVKTPPSGVNTENGAHTPITWPYYSLLDSFYSERHCINPPFLIDTSFSPSPSSESRTSSSPSPTFFPNFIIPSLTSSTYLNRPPSPTTPPPAIFSSLPYVRGIPVPSSSSTPNPGPSSSSSISTPSSSSAPTPSSSSVSSTILNPVPGPSSAATPDEGRPLPVTTKRKRPRRTEKDDEDPLLKYLKEQDDREQRNTERLFSILERFLGAPPQ